VRLQFESSRTLFRLRQRPRKDRLSSCLTTETGLWASEDSPTFALISEQCQDWSLLIIGDGPEKSPLQNAASEHGLDELVTFAGWIESPWSVIPPITPRSASIAVLPSRYEGFPNALLEAMSRGIATIAFDCESGPSEIIRHDENGLLVPQGNIPELAAAMQSLAHDNDRRTRLADAARDVNDRFSPERVYAMWEDVLRGC
jgi:GalNAc-alpha-(1->4)-GalNAc-alpha-(1->3)-diNAcBac-PP-undecaprenol alpha-1,4-N-acetyl-D-galactosaminyltransferase